MKHKKTPPSADRPKALSAAMVSTRARSNSSLVNRTRADSNSSRSNVPQLTDGSESQTPPQPSAADVPVISLELSNYPETVPNSVHEDRSDSSSRHTISSLHSSRRSTHDTSGFFSSIINVAHNAANIITSSYDEPTSPSNSSQTQGQGNNSKSHKHISPGGIAGSIGHRLDTLLKPKSRSPSGAAESPPPASSNASTSDRATQDSNGPVTLLPSNVHFDPVRESPVHTMGSGDLSLSHFDKVSPQPQPQLTVDDALVVDSSTIRTRPLSSPNQSSEQVPTTADLRNELKKTVSPDLVNRLLPVSNQLSTAGTGENKVVRRRSMSNAALENVKLRNESVEDTPLEGEEQSEDEDLDQIIDYKHITLADAKRNKEFHQTFPKKITSKEKLVDDFSCALSKDILVQGRMYLSEHFVCFNSNILGWVTNLVIPLQEVIQIEKKSTAGLFPNGMIIRTLHHKYVFATFLSRDSSFNIIVSVWHRVLLEGSDVDTHKLISTANRRTRRKRGESKSSNSKILDFSGNDDIVSADYTDSGEETEISMSSDEHNDIDSLSSLSLKAGTSKKSEENDNSAADDIYNDSQSDEFIADKPIKESTSTTSVNKVEDGENTFRGLPCVGPLTHEPTEIDHSKDTTEVFITEDVIEAPMGVIYNLLFGKDNKYFVKVLEAQQNFDILENDITELSNKSRERHYTYTKPLLGPIGPKQTKCFIVDKLIEFKLEDYVLVEQITSTPDIPSGNSFQVKTKLYLSWANDNGTNLYVVTTVEWSGKSWIKGTIEKGSIEGQKESMKIMVDTINDILGSLKTKGGEKKRRNTGSSHKAKKQKKKKAASPISNPESKPPTLSSLLGQLHTLVETIGKLLIPVELPFVSDFSKGLLLVGFLWLIWRSILPKPQLLDLAPEPLLSKVRVNNQQYIVIPKPDAYMADKARRMETEMNLWDWLREKSEGEIDIQTNQDKRNDKDLLKDYSYQEVQEIVKITQKRLEELSEQIR